MPRAIVELSVLISCPSDLAAERQIVESAIAEINPILKQTHGVVLEPLTWDRNVVPGVGRDPQDVINSQLKDRFDIYFGLLGTRFGSETPRAGSGTAEEFQQAYTLYGESPERVRVLFYFKTNTEGVHRLDLQQLHKVIEFQRELHKAGVLYHEFADPDALLRDIKTHLLQLIAEQFDGKKWKVLSPLSPNPRLSAPVVEEIQEIVKADSGGGDIDTTGLDDEPGIFDVIVAGEAAFQAALKTLNAMSELMGTLTERTNNRSTLLKTAADGQNARRVREIIDGSADDLEEYSTGLRKEAAALRAEMTEGLDSMETAIKIYFNERLGSKEALGDVPGQLSALTTGIKQSRTSLDSFRGTIAQLPGFTSKFKRSKKKTIQLLGELSGLLTVFLERAESVGKEYANRISEGS